MFQKNLAVLKLSFNAVMGILQSSAQPSSQGLSSYRPLERALDHEFNGSGMESNIHFSRAFSSIRVRR